MKKYALVNGKHVRYADLRETPKFLLSDCSSNYKFKKVKGKDFIASNSTYSNHYRVGYNVYEVDHPYVLAVIEAEKKSYFVYNVRREIEKLHLERSMSFGEASRINELLNLGVELK